MVDWSILKEIVNRYSIIDLDNMKDDWTYIYVAEKNFIIFQ